MVGSGQQQLQVAAISEALASLADRQRQAIQRCVDEWVGEQELLLLQASMAAETHSDAGGGGGGGSRRPWDSVLGCNRSPERRPLDISTVVTSVPGEVAPSVSQDVEDVLGATVFSEKQCRPRPAEDLPISRPSGERVVGKKRGRKQKRDNLVQKSHQVVTEEETCLERLTESTAYEWFSAGLIVSNAIFEGVKTEILCRDIDRRTQSGMSLTDIEPSSFVAIQVIFWLLFMLDLGLRWAADGLRDFFRGDDRRWNIFDAIVVAFTTVDVALLLATSSMSASDGIPSVSMLRLLRIVRIIRVAKVVRVMRFFMELRMMVYSIANAMRSLIWTFLVLGIVFYIFGIVFTVATIDFANTADKRLDPENAELLDHFGTLSRSTLYLYMSMSGGVDWSECYLPLERLSPLYAIFFILFLTFSIFVVSNIVTGVMVETAISTNKKDNEMVVREELEAKKSCLDSLRMVFQELDLDDTGSLTLDEFDECLSQETVVAYFNAMKLDVTDAQALFQILDHDQSCELSIEEFLDGVFALMGESRTLDLKIMQFQIRNVSEAVLTIQKQTRNIAARVGAAEDTGTAVHTHSR